MAVTRNVFLSPKTNTRVKLAGDVAKQQQPEPQYCQPQQTGSAGHSLIFFANRRQTESACLPWFASDSRQLQQTVVSMSPTKKAAGKGSKRKQKYES